MIRRWRTPPVTEEEKPKGFDDFDLHLGDLMRGERATLGKSLLDVQRELKIKATYIAAIENADPSAFETPGFIAGYVRSYARYLGMDPEWVYETFCREAGFATVHGMSAEASSAKPSRAEHKGDPLSNPNASFVPRAESIFAGIEPGALGSVAILLALIGVLGFGGWSVLQEIQRVDFAPVEQTPGVMSDLQDFGLHNTQIANVTGGAGLNTPPSADAMDRLYRPQALDVPVLVARDGPISTLNPREVGVLAQAGSVPAAPVQPAEDAVAMAIASAVAGVQVLGAQAPEVTIFAVRPSWVRVQAADGAVIFEKILDAGEKYVLPRSETPPLLRAGNAGSVYFAVNGDTYGPAGDGGAVVKNVPLSPDDVTGQFMLADITRDSDLATYVAMAETGSGQ